VVIVERDNDFGDYLRACRDAVTPAVAGLPDDGSRKVPGLRRDEVALLAGVSTDYYTRLEQGRERRPSEQSLRAIARALRLDEAPTVHLFRLGMPALATETEAVAEVGRDLVRLMDSVHQLPAFVVGSAQDVLAANAMAEALYAGFARFDNLLRMIFLDPFAREFYADWDRAAGIAVGNLRASSARFPGDRRIEAVLGGLSAHSPVFASLWARYEVRPRAQEDKRFRHPQVGLLHLHYEALAVTSAPGQHLSVYTAEPGSPTADGLVLLSRLAAQDQLADSPTESNNPTEEGNVHS